MLRFSHLLLRWYIPISTTFMKDLFLSDYNLNSPKFKSNKKVKNLIRLTTSLRTYAQNWKSLLLSFLVWILLLWRQSKFVETEFDSVLLSKKTTSNANRDTSYDTWVSSRPSLLQTFAENTATGKTRSDVWKKCVSIHTKKCRRPDTSSERACPYSRTLRFCCKRKIFKIWTKYFRFCSTTERIPFVSSFSIQHVLFFERVTSDEILTSSMMTIPGHSVRRDKWDTAECVQMYFWREKIVTYISTKSTSGDDLTNTTSYRIPVIMIAASGHRTCNQRPRQYDPPFCSDRNSCSGRQSTWKSTHDSRS